MTAFNIDRFTTSGVLPRLHRVKDMGMRRGLR
jgi:hypothetical protein